jgi:hypothetical protein
MADEPKPPMPDVLRPLGEAALARMRKRRAVPQTETRPQVRGRPGAWGFLECPYREEDLDLWAALILECFGTRVLDVGQAFMRQLAAMCPDVLYEGEDHSRVDEEALRQALAIVYAMRPRDEAEAAFAAQLVAVHLVTMTMGSTLRHHVDRRSANALAGLVKAYGQGLTALRGMQAPARRRSRQTFITKKEIHVHQHHHDERHLHVQPPEGEGGGILHAQAQERRELRARASPANRASERAALPSPDPLGQGLPVSEGEGPEKVPIARRGEGIGGTERGS